MKIWIFLILNIFFTPTVISEKQPIQPLSIQKKQKKIREYVLYNYRPLSLDILSPDGIYLKGLCFLLEKNCNKNELLVALVSNKSIVDFARQVSSMLK